MTEEGGRGGEVKIMSALAEKPGVFGLKFDLVGAVSVDSWELVAAGNRWSRLWLGISPPAPQSPLQTCSQEEDIFTVVPTGVFPSGP